MQLSDSAQAIRSPIRPPKRNSNPNVSFEIDCILQSDRVSVQYDKLSKILQSECVAPSNNHADESDCQCTIAGPEVSNGTSGNSENWMVLSIAGDKPIPRFNVRC